VTFAILQICDLSSRRSPRSDFITSVTLQFGCPSERATKKARPRTVCAFADRFDVALEGEPHRPVQASLAIAERFLTRVAFTTVSGRPHIRALTPLCHLTAVRRNGI